MATPEQEKLRWRELLLAESEALQAVGLRVHEGAWYFSTLQFLRLNRLSVGNRRMRSFPNKAFLVENGIIPPEQDAIQASEAYPKLFEALGIPVTTLEEEQRL